MQEESDIYSKVSNDPIFNNLLDNLTYRQFVKGKNIPQVNIPIEFGALRKAIWICSILAGSANEEHRKKAQLFAALAYLHDPDNIEIEQACYLILSRTGNLAATTLFKTTKNLYQHSIEAGQSIYKFDALLDLEINSELGNKLIVLTDGGFVATRFQKKLWDELLVSNRISISAPTSAGKSFVIKKYIVEQLNKQEKYKALYIVPSRALINQVSEEFRKEVNLEEVDVNTTYLATHDSVYKEKQLYILTAERCLKLLQDAYERELVFDLIFIDEIQNLENEDGRGSVLEYVLTELGALFPTAKIIIAGPNIIETGRLYNDIFNQQSVPVETTVSPVFQIKTIIRPLAENKLSISLKTLSGKSQTFEIEVDSDIRKKFNKSYAEGLPPIIDLFSQDDQNIIFCPKTDLVEDWATYFVGSSQNIQESEDKLMHELIEYLEEEIHPKYFLIKCLEQKAAFHHSKLPDIVRKEIEDGYLGGRIKNLFCTSTLLEGVNLPANNLFVVSPRKLNESLSSFEFGNLIGRAGRIKNYLYGTIYCIERDKNDDKWAQEYYDANYQKEVQTATHKSFDDYDDFMNLLGGEIDQKTDGKHANTIILLRHKYLTNKNGLIHYLRKKNLNENKIQRVFETLESSLADVIIPSKITSLNPSIDPLKQNELFVLIKGEGIENWMITPNPNFYQKISKARKDQFEFEDLSFYWQLVSIMTRLDNVFGVQKEAYFKHSVSDSLSQICLYGIKWLGNTSYKKLIDEDIRFYSNHLNPRKRIKSTDVDAVNVRIKEVIKIYNTIVTHVLVKYLKLLNDILEPILTDEQKEKYKFSLALPTMMELGTSEKVVIQLISVGVSRSVALKVFGEFKKVQNHENIDVFEWLRGRKRLNLKPIYNRYLRRMRLFSLD